MSPPPETPVRVGARYELGDKIGQGAMGAVWRATDELLNRTVAVKELLAVVVPPTAAGYDALEESRQRILREGRIGARLHHPHVIRMYDVVVHDDRPWLVMEYLPSRSMSAVLSEGTLPLREAANIGRQVADGLAAAHAAGVVHRDVKPGNVLIADDGLVKIADFGVSRAVDDVQLTRTGLIAGTPAFLSPEVARGLNPTSASDIFALGATLYAAIEGTPPFGLDENAYALLHKVATEPVRPPKAQGPVVDVIMWLLSRDPADRPTAEQARESLAAAANGRDTGLAPAAAAAPAAPVAPSAPPARPGPQTLAELPRPQPRRRRKLLIPILIGALAVLAAGVGVGAALLTGAASGDPDPAGANPPPAVGAAATPSESPSAVPTEASGAAPATAPTTAAAPTTAPPTTTAAPSTTAAPAPAAGDPIAFVQSYYALLPGNTDAAWALLGSDAQNRSGGKTGYDGFYGTLSSVSLQDVRQAGENTVDATIVFTTHGGVTTNEPYRFTLGTNGAGDTIIESFSHN